MASLLDYYTPPSSTPPAFMQEGINRQAGYAGEDAGLKQTLAKRQFENRTMPDLVNRQASRGAFHSGSTGVLADRAKENYLTDQGDTSRLLQRTMADLSRNRILASIGVAI